MHVLARTLGGAVRMRRFSSHSLAFEECYEEFVPTGVQDKCTHQDWLTDFAPERTVEPSSFDTQVSG